jgi:hypothetical protein
VITEFELMPPDKRPTGSRCMRHYKVNRIAKEVWTPYVITLFGFSD